MTSPIDELWEKYGEAYARVGIDRDAPVPDQLWKVREALYRGALSRLHHELRVLLLNGEAPLSGQEYRAVIVPTVERRIVSVLDAQDMLPIELLDRIAPKTTINRIELEPIKKKQRAQGNTSDALAVGEGG